MSLLSKQDYDLVVESLEFFADLCDELTIEEKRQITTLTQRLTLESQQKFNKN